jgi:hypothetical protein
MVTGRAKVARTLDALRNNKILLNKAVQHITISLETKKTGNTGTRYGASFDLCSDEPTTRFPVCKLE